MDYEELKKKIETFSLDDGDLGSQGYERVLLQLFGITGHGKSSFINSCMFVLNDGGPFVEYAEAEKNICGGSMTMIRKAYELTDNITIVDNRGLKNNFEGAEVYAQLGNFHPLNQTIQWKENFNDAISALEENELDTDVSDLLIPVFIYSAGNILEGQEEEDVKSFLKNCVSMTGNFYPLDQPVEWKENLKDAMLALVERDLDKNTTDFLVPIFIYSAAYILPQEKEDVKAFLKNCDKMTGVVPIIGLTNKTGGDFTEVEKKFRLMGAETVIAIENYTTDSHVKTLGRTTDILRIIHMALENVTFRLSLPRDPERDQRDRKEFLLNYIHEAEPKYDKAKLVKDDMSQKTEKKKSRFLKTI